MTNMRKPPQLYVSMLEPRDTWPMVVELTYRILLILKESYLRDLIAIIAFQLFGKSPDVLVKKSPDLITGNIPIIKTPYKLICSKHKN